MKTKNNTLSILTLFFLSALLPAAVSRAESGTANVETYSQLLQAIRQTRQASTERIEQAVEEEKVREAWETGKLIDEHILIQKERQNYGEQVIIRLSKDLGISETELKYRLQFARTYPIRRPADELSWSHYQALLAINDPKEREEVIKAAVQNKWDREQVRDAVRKYKSKTEPSAEPSEPKTIPKAVPGKASVYKVIEKDGKKYYDLGFFTFRRLLGNEPTRFKAGDYVFIKSSGPTYQPILSKPAPGDLYTYKAKVLDVVDGDTFHALVDLGFGISVQQRIRLLRLDASEILSAEGKKAKEVLEKALKLETVSSKPDEKARPVVLIQSKELDQHGRPLANVFVKSARSVKASADDTRTTRDEYESIDGELLSSGFFTLRNGE